VELRSDLSPSQSKMLSDSYYVTQPLSWKRTKSQQFTAVFPWWIMEGNGPGCGNPGLRIIHLGSLSFSVLEKKKKLPFFF